MSEIGVRRHLGVAHSEMLAFPALLELMGHAYIAGTVSKNPNGLWTVFVPQTSVEETFIREYGTGAIYALTYLSDEEMRRCAEKLGCRKIERYDLQDHPVDTRGILRDEYAGYYEDDDVLGDDLRNPDEWDDYDGNPLVPDAQPITGCFGGTSTDNDIPF